MEKNMSTNLYGLVKGLFGSDRLHRELIKMLLMSMLRMVGDWSRSLHQVWVSTEFQGTTN